MIEFVVREGPMFEAMIMNREINNPMYRSARLFTTSVLPLNTLVVNAICMLMFYDFFLPGFYLRTKARHMYTTGGSCTPYYRFACCILKLPRKLTFL